MIIHDVGEYVQQTVVHPPYFVEHLLPRGGSLLLYGRAGEMKSWLAQHIAFCIATGTEWLDFSTTQARVLLVNFEISSASYHQRLKHMAESFSLEDGMLYAASPSMMYLDEPYVFTRFKDEVEDLDPDVVILDCLSGCYGGDENSSSEMSQFLKNVNDLKGERRGIILIHHSNKNLLSLSPMDRARGHTKLTGWVDSILYVVSQGRSAGKQLQFGKVRLAPFQIFSKNIMFEDYVFKLRNTTSREEG